MEQKLYDAAAKLPETTLEFESIADHTPVLPTSKKSWKKLLTLAACLLVMLSIGIGSFAISAEAKTYQDALNFFNTYGLSAEGLSREEIKLVYQDITEETFSHSITAEVIVNSIGSPVDGYVITQGESIEELWKLFNSTARPIVPTVNTGVHYKYRNEYAPNNPLKFENACFEKYDGETLLWSLTVYTAPIREYFPVSDGVFISGSDGSLVSGKAWFAKVDPNGNLLWITQLQHGFSGELIHHILENEDGTYAVLSRGELTHICLSQYTPDGKELSSHATEVGNMGVGVATKMSDGYGVQLFSFYDNEHSKIIKLDMQGNITATFDYDSDQSYYYITDMLELDGKLYLSTYMTPKRTGITTNTRYEIHDILDYIFSEERWGITSEELTPLVQENYTAVLLVCDPASGTPQEFYSVDSSLGGKLGISDAGHLSWDVERITTAYFSLATSAFTIAGGCAVYQYTFCDGTVTQLITGETTGFYR